MRKNLLKKNLGEEIIKLFFEASDIPSQSLCFWEETPLNNSGMCDDQDGKICLKEPCFWGSKTLGVKTS